MGTWTVPAWPILVSAALKSTLVLGAAWIFSTLLRRRSAAARHIVWTASAAALIALPLLSFVLPAMRLSLANKVLPVDSGLVFRTTTVTGGHDGATGAAQNASQATNGGTASPARSAPRIPLLTRDLMALVWMAGFAASLLQMCAAFLMLRRTRGAARPSPDQGMAAELALDLGIEQPVEVLETASVMPMTFGIWRPTVLLPEAARAWSQDRRRVVLLHELGHIARGDAATQLLARAALAVNWWNPLAWIAWREFLKERERATDDLVLTHGAAASEYAGHLLEIARTLQFHAADSVAGVAMARRSELEGRLLSILDGQVQRGNQRRMAALCAAVAAVAIIAPLAAVRAQSQADQDAPPAVDAAIVAATQAKNHEILDQAAVKYEQLRKWAEAQKLREASLAMAAQSSGQTSKDYALALVKLGDLARSKGSLADAKQYYEKALALGDRPEVFPALIAMGRMSVMNTVRTFQPPSDNPVISSIQSTTDSLMQAAGIRPDPAKALDYFTRARNVAANGNDMATALTNMALAHQALPDGEAEVEPLLRSAISSASQDSSEEALALEYYARFLKAHDRATEADSAEASARAIRRQRVRALAPLEAAVSSVFNVGGGVTAPRLLYKVEPEYSEEARANKYQGSFAVKVTIDVDGLAKDPEIVRGLGFGLDEQAILAIARWRFKPGEKDGLPVPVRATIEVNFKLL